MWALLRLIALLLAASATPTAAAELRLAAMFSDHAVLQRGRPIPVWGWAEPGAAVEVRFAGRSAAARAGADGRWQAELPALAASFEPRTLTASTGGESVGADDVLVGEVWYAAGQSNMEWRLVHTDGGVRAIGQSEIPGLRLMLAEPACAAEPRDDAQPLWRTQGETDAWQPSRPWAANRFGALGFYFGAELRRALDVPVGVIQAAVGGTRIEGWTPEAVFRREPAFAAEAAWLNQAQAAHRAAERSALSDHRAWQAAAERTPLGAALPDPPTWPVSPAAWYNRPTCFHNGMVAGLTPYAIAGMAWYQGESNVPEGERYFVRLSAFIAAMREVWRRPDLPVALLQLAPYDAPSSVKLPLVWEAQLKAAGTPGVGLVTLSDTVADVTNLHPPNKRDPALRLARWALSAVYGRPDPTPTGPLYRAHAVEDGRLRIGFHHARGLSTRLGEPVDSVEIAGADRHFRPATAVIDGETLVVSSADVPVPAAVRFGWTAAARPNLINAAGLPAASFRTDEWPFPELR